MSLAPTTFGFSTGTTNLPKRGFPEIEDLAGALIALGKVSSQRLASVCISGGPACGWLAAVAIWLLGLSVNISDGNNQLYPVTAGDTNAQVQFILERTRLDSCGSAREITMVDETYRLRDSYELLKDNLLGDEAVCCTFLGRVPWKCCLSTAFGRVFCDLIKMTHEVGTAFGCAARIFEEAFYDNKICENYSQSETGRFHFDDSYGIGFVHHSLKCFPELAPSKIPMTQAVKMTFSDAMTSYERIYTIIQERCSCYKCHRGCSTRDPNALCLATLLETVIALSLVLSTMIVPECLLPTRKGLAQFYPHVDGWITREIDFVGTNGRTWKAPNPLHILGATRHDAITEGLNIFTGRDAKSEEISLRASAAAKYGLCFYFDALRELSVDKELSGRLHVVPGRIEHQGRPFNLVTDLEMGGNLPNPLSQMNEVVLSKSSLLCRERTSGLNVCFAVSDDNDTTTFHVGPCRLTNRLTISARWYVNCKGSKSDVKCQQLVSVRDIGQQIEKCDIDGQKGFNPQDAIDQY
ncbi:hypothetical protein F5Y08DRAFT_352230 [Xylaria arbuscula]|nr:hypothetical protein F5Y08DRAFT_352230 [Xylaria arbuscula]